MSLVQYSPLPDPEQEHCPAQHLVEYCLQSKVLKKRMIWMDFGLLWGVDEIAWIDLLSPLPGPRGMTNYKIRVRMKI